MRKINKGIIVSLSAVFIFMTCSNISINETDTGEIVISKPITSVMPTITNSYKTPEITIEPLEEKPFSDEEVEAIVRTLAGECYDDKMADKRKIVEVIVNRVSDGGFGENVIDVVTAKGQFAGYWNQSRRPVSESDIQIAEETLTDWYENDCKALSEYLFFSSGLNRENVFRFSINVQKRHSCFIKRINLNRYDYKKRGE